MHIEPVPYSPKAVAVNQAIESAINTLVRGYDSLARPFGRGFRRSNYDDLRYEFAGGPSDTLRKQHYDKSLRLLWKAEEQAPFTNFKDCSPEEKMLWDLAGKAMNKAEKAKLKRISTKEFRELLNREYTQEQKQAIVNVLSLIGHGEAYAWLVSTEVLRDVRSTGGRAALTMQVLEEAKHFVVLREILLAFDCEIPRLPVWEYLLLERIFKLDGLEKFFGMNVLVESIALSLFGLMSDFPGLEFLRMFHLDESRHTALPHNYFSEFPMTAWEKYSPLATASRLLTVLPALPLLYTAEKDLATLGIDPFEFAGSLLRKAIVLSERVGFYLPIPGKVLSKQLNAQFNLYCKLTRPYHEYQNFFEAEATTGKRELKVEAELFGLGA